jgi:Flp pilus assembly pilin Flp
MTFRIAAMKDPGLAPFCRRFAEDQSGQDLVEYALLAAIVGMAGILLLPSIQSSMREAYERWSASAQEMADP